MELQTPKISTRPFMYSPSDNTFVACASDLRGFRLGRIYDDACDVGFTLISQRTGREIVFALAHEERDRDGDLRWEDFRPVNRNEWGAGTVRIYND